MKNQELEEKLTMWTQEVSAEQLAQLFHHCREAHGDHSTLGGRRKSESWEALSPTEKHRSIEAARLTLMEMGATSEAPDDSRRYFEKPGEAEWGC